MFNEIPYAAGSNATANRVLRQVTLVLDHVKDSVVGALSGVPVIGSVVNDMPSWVIGVVIIVLAPSIPYFVVKTISIFKQNAMGLVMKTPLGDVVARMQTASHARAAVSNKDYVGAANMYMSIGDDMKAIHVLEKGGELALAGKVYEKLGMLDKAAEYYQKGKDAGRLADLYIKKGDFRKAGEVLVMSGKKLTAAEAFEKAGEHRKAADLYAECGTLGSAASCYEKAGEYRQAAEMYDRGYYESASSKEVPTPDVAARLREMSVKAGEYFEKVGNFDKAAEAFSRVGEHARAGEAALAGKDSLKAAAHFRRAKQFECAAGIYRDAGEAKMACEVMADMHTSQGNEAEAARMYFESGDHIKAAELFESSGEYAMAAEAYMVSGDFGTAAQLYLDGGEQEKAAGAFARDGQKGRAAQIYIQLGQMDRASALVEASGDYVLAAELHGKMGRTDKALAALQKVSPDDPRYNDAVHQLAQAFKSSGDLKLAAEYYLKAIGGMPADHGNLELYYGLAGVYEADKRWDDAAKAYEKVLLVDFQYHDADAKKKECDRQAAAAAKLAAQKAAQKAAPGVGETSDADAAKRYSIIKEIGRGGMGVVYEAKDNNLNRVIALKLLPKSFSDNEQVLKRFAQEARSAARLNHQNIVTLYDFQQAGGRSFITMELVEGVTLKKLLASAAKMPLVNKLKIIYQCCQGLHYAHEAGIIHRDIKPSNIMINKQSIVKIMDFGLAKVGGEETLTDAGMISGTVMYMSPEQLVGEKLDRRTDLYSLGLVFYELVALRHPFAEGDAAYQHVHTPPKPPRALNPAIPDKLDQIIMKCLEKDRSKRFASAAEFAMSLREVPLK